MHTAESTPRPFSTRARTVVAKAVCARTIQARTTCTIVATNAAGSTSTNISIAVNPRNRKNALCYRVLDVHASLLTTTHLSMVPSLQPSRLPLTTPWLESRCSSSSCFHRSSPRLLGRNPSHSPVRYSNHGCSYQPLPSSHSALLCHTPSPAVELPPGLQVDESNGTIYGTPTQLFKLSQVTIVATNPFVGSAVATLLMEVTASTYHAAPRIVLCALHELICTPPPLPLLLQLHRKPSTTRPTTLLCLSSCRHALWPHSSLPRPSSSRPRRRFRRACSCPVMAVSAASRSKCWSAHCTQSRPPMTLVPPRHSCALLSNQVRPPHHRLHHHRARECESVRECARVCECVVH